MYEFEKNNEEEGVTMGELATKLMGSAVRFFGFILMLFGLWVALIVMWEAQALYDDPKAIEKLAQHIERGSNIDAGLVSVSESDKTLKSNTKNANKNTHIRVSYFFAWVIAILLLLLIARIALGAIKTGGELVLFDVHIKRFAKELAKESMRMQK